MSELHFLTVLGQNASTGAGGIIAGISRRDPREIEPGASNQNRPEFAAVHFAAGVQRRIGCRAA